MMPDGNEHPSLKKSFSFALEGIVTAFRAERNVKLILGLGLLAIIAGFILEIDNWAWCIVLLLIGLLVSAELINTALEAVVDLCSPDFHALAKLAKDVAAGSVLVLSITAVLIGLIIYGSALIALVFA